MKQSKMNEALNKVAEHTSLEFIRDNLEKIRHCVATGVPIIIKDGELVDPGDMFIPLIRHDGPYKYEPTTTLPPFSFKESAKVNKEFFDKGEKKVKDALHKLKTGRQHD